MSEHPPYPQYPAYPPAPPPPAAPDGRPLADAGTRLAARIVDSIIFAVVATLLAAVVAGSLVSLTATTAGKDSPAVPAVGITAIVLIMLAIIYVYEVEIPLRRRGQTPGKRVMKIAVIPLEPGAPLRRSSLVYRAAVMTFFNILGNCYIGLVDPLWCLWDKPYRQTLHDKPARTVVIKQPS